MAIDNNLSELLYNSESLQTISKQRKHLSWSGCTTALNSLN